MSDINELFRKDPLSCGKEDIRAIVEVFRQKRVQFNLGAKQAGNINKKLTAKEEATSKAVDLSGLDFGI